MSLETDLLLDRRRLKSRLILWRSLTVILLVVALLIGFGRMAGTLTSSSRHIARLDIQGTIGTDSALEKKIRDLAENDSALGLIVRINSPGGSVAGGEGLHDAIAKVAAKKPVVAVMGSTAASAGYMVALPAARIFARGSTLTGSIGVLLETGEASVLMDRVGIRAEAITSGPLKDQPSLTKPLSPEGRLVLRGLVDDIFDQFVTMVATERKMDKTRVLQFADGRAYTGRQALELGLIDQIGDEGAAREWLDRDRQLPITLPVRDLNEERWTRRVLQSSLGGIWDRLAKTLFGQSLMLDGAMAVWQPSSTGG